MSWTSFGIGVLVGFVFTIFALCGIAALFRHSWNEELEGQYEPRDDADK